MSRTSVLHFGRKWFLALAAGVFLIGSPAAATGAESSGVIVGGQAAADPSRSTVFIQRDLGGGRGRAGTGTVVACEGGKSLVLTNAHVADDPDGTYTVTHAGRAHPATYVAGSPVRHTSPTSMQIDGPDVALLAVEATLPAATIAPEVPRPGDRVRLWGFGGRSAAQGAAEKAGQTLDAAAYVEPTFVSDADTTSGDSGSGVFNDAGELVAVHWGGDGQRAHAVPLGTVRAFLRDKSGKSFPRLSERMAADLKAESPRAESPKAVPAKVTSAKAESAPSPPPGP